MSCMLLVSGCWLKPLVGGACPDLHQHMCIQSAVQHAGVPLHTLHPQPNSSVTMS